MPSAVKPSWPAELYALARPDYPAEVVEAILSSPSSKGPLNVIDLGAGTGICSKLLIEACRKSSKGDHKLASITSLDAAPNMLEELSKTLYQSGGLVPLLQEKGELDQGLKTGTAVSKFEDFEVSKFGLQGKVDLITIAQAWHWCSDWEKALNNMADALQTGGVLALLWNLEDREAATWVGKVRDTYEKYENDTPQYRHRYWKKMYDTSAMDRFEIIPPQHHTRQLPTTLDGVCNRVKSKSYISVLPEETQNEVDNEIRSLMETSSGDELQRIWIDKDKGTFVYPYVTGEWALALLTTMNVNAESPSTDLLLFRKK